MTIVLQNKKHACVCFLLETKTCHKTIKKISNSGDIYIKDLYGQYMNLRANFWSRKYMYIVHLYVIDSLI